MRRITGYVRVSRVAGRNGDSFQSPAAQEEVIRAHARARRQRVVKVEHELDESGGTMQRPKLQTLIAEIKAGQLDGIVVARLDRFARTVKGGLDAIEQIHEAGGFIQAADGSIDTSADSATGELQLSIFLAIAQWERRTRAENFEAAKERAVARRVHIAGRVPVGYRRPGRGQPLELDGRTADAIRAAFELRATGASVGSVVRFLDERLPGGASGKAGTWTAGTVSRVLENRVYLGEARQGKHVHPKAHPAIVDVETFDTVQALARQTRPRQTPNGTRSLLAGLIRCAGCGYAMQRTVTKQGYVIYRCRGASSTGKCPAKASAMMHAVDAYVEQAALDRMRRLGVERTPAADDRVDEIHGRIAAVRAKRDEFDDADVFAALGKERFLRAVAKADAELDALEVELAAALEARGDVEQTVDVQAAVDLWSTLSTDEKREVLARELDAVMLSRAPGAGVRVPIAERVELRWRGDGLPTPRPSKHGSKVETGVAPA